jgi:hypothetical protein
VVFRSQDIARIGTLKDQLIIPLEIPTSPSYISTNKDLTIEKGDDKNQQNDDKFVTLSLGYAVFCASGKPAFISPNVAFFLLSS